MSAPHRTHEEPPPGSAYGMLSPVGRVQVFQHRRPYESEENSMTTMNATLRQPSAFLPVAMSLVALAVVLGHVALFGAAHEADEGTAAHIWQLLMAVQVPI